MNRKKHYPKLVEQVYKRILKDGFQDATKSNVKATLIEQKFMLSNGKPTKKAVKTFGIDENGNISNQHLDFLFSPTKSGVIKDSELLDYIYKIYLQNNDSKDVISKDEMYWHLIELNAIKYDGTPTYSIKNLGWKSAKPDKKVIYPPLVEQAYKSLREQALPVTKADTYKELVGANLIDKYGKATKFALDHGYVSEFETNGLKPNKSAENVIYPPMVEASYDRIKEQGYETTKAEVSRRLIKHGLMTKKGKPTQYAIDSGFLIPYDPDKNDK